MKKKQGVKKFLSKKTEVFSLNWWLLADRQAIKSYLRLWVFASCWLAVPLFFWLVFLSSRNLPTIYQGEPVFNPPSTERTVAFKLKLRGVATAVSAQPIFLKGLNPQNGQTFTFENLPVSQDSQQPEIFHGSITVDQSALAGSYTFWLKGPLHLQRRFENLSLGPAVLDFTEKPLLPGDLKLPETGQDDKVDQLDQDYLWSLLARGGSASAEELKAADLDLDGKITGRDQSLLSDTGVGTEGEK